jgi:predicted transcriptional regulator of viral defense system
MPSIATKTSELLRLAGSGPLRTRDVDAAGIPRVYLRRLCERGLLERVDRGLYRLPEAPVTELHSLVEVARRVPHATVALLSALQVHGLTTEAPHAVWILIDRHARTPKVTYPKLEVVYASGPALVHGVETRTIEGVPVRLTTPAKTVADCFRYRRHVGLEVALAALRGYLGRPVARGGTRRTGSPIDDLIAAARADRISAVLRPYLEALA